MRKLTDIEHEKLRRQIRKGMGRAVEKLRGTQIGWVDAYYALQDEALWCLGQGKVTNGQIANILDGIAEYFRTRERANESEHNEDGLGNGGDQRVAEQGRSELEAENVLDVQNSW